MIFLVNEPPKRCPKCGEEIRWNHGHQDFYAGASHSCNCGANYQFVPASALIEASKANGDLSRYAYADN